MSDPGNPIFVREIRQAARITRTPTVLMTISVSVTLLIAGVGGALTDDKAPDEVGSTVFRVFFSVAFAVATLIGAAVAANGVAAEREGRTFEALVLTSLSPSDIAVGKFFAALTSVGSYLMIIAPAGALAFLFGGVSATEVFIAFFFLGLFAATFVGLGLAISSKMESVRASLLVTLLFVFPLALGGYVIGGIAASGIAESVWSLVPRGNPIWLPLAYTRGELGEHYVVALIITPMVFLATSWWLFYEVTVANLKGPSDDRSSGLKRWFAVAVPLVVGVTIAWIRIAPAGSRRESVQLALCMISALFVFGTFLFAGEPATASNRVLHLVRRERWSALRRFMGPGVVGTGFLQMIVGVVAFGVLAAALNVMMEKWRLEPTEHYIRMWLRLDLEIFMLTLATFFAFHLFFVGLGSVLRLRYGEAGARVRLAAVLAAALVVPWIVAAIVGAINRAEGDLLPATASPAFILTVIGREERFNELKGVIHFWIVAYGVVGLALQLFAAARMRVRGQARTMAH